jgi:hypothetical protein
MEANKVEDIIHPPAPPVTADLTIASKDSMIADSKEPSSPEVAVTDQWEEATSVVAPPSAPAETKVVSESMETGFEPLGWSCNVCTFINEDGDVTCAICGAARDTSTPQADQTGWWCSVCTLINPLASQR